MRCLGGCDVNKAKDSDGLWLIMRCLGGCDVNKAKDSDGL